MPVRLHHAVLSCVVARARDTHHLDDRARARDALLAKHASQVNTARDLQQVPGWAAGRVCLRFFPVPDSRLASPGNEFEKTQSAAMEPVPFLLISEFLVFCGPHQSSDCLGDLADVLRLAQKSIRSCQVCVGCIDSGR